MSFWNNTTDKPAGSGEPAMNLAAATPVPQSSPLPQPPPPAQAMPERTEPAAKPKREQAAAAPEASDLLLGRGARFEGKLTFQGTVRIDATFIGSIVTNDVLVVGEAARIDAEISCGTIVVHGEVNGNIQAKTAVEIQRTGKVRGDLETPSLVIEKGALFQGAVRMEPGAKAAAKKAEKVEKVEKVERAESTEKAAIAAR